MRAQSELLSEILAGRSWRDDAEAFAESMGLTVAVMRAGTATSPSHARCPVCFVPTHCGCGDSVPGLSCFETGTFSRRPAETVVYCASGMSCGLRRVGNGDPLTYVLVTGYLRTESQRKDLLGRLLVNGIPEREARAVARKTPAMGERSVLAAARLAASHLEALVHAADVAAADRRGAAFERVYAMEGDPTAAPRDAETLPASLLERALTISGAAAGALYRLEPGGEGLTRAVLAGAGELLPEALPERVALGETPAGIAAGGRSALLVPAADGAPSLAAPLIDDDDLLGAVVLVYPDGADAPDERDLKLVGLFADSAAHALANALRFSEANERVVELMQLNELARALHADSELDNLTYLVTGVLDKLIGFEVGGLVLLGREERGRVVLHGDVTEADLTALLGEVTGMALDTPFLERCAVVTPGGRLLPDDGRPSAKWTILAEDVSTLRPEAGYLFVASRRPDAFDATDARLLRAEAAHASAALEKSRVYARLRADLERVVGALSAMLDAAERCKEGHADKVTDHALAIGVELGLPSEDLETLRFAGLLHDIGKLGVAEEIILKPAALTQEEMAEVRRHAEIGAGLVEQMEFLGEIAPVILHHHERWDGRGYPDGLAGEDIPPLSRILAVADAFATMTSERVYSKALPLSTARIELERGAGTQFDPDVVRAFLGILDRGAAGALRTFSPDEGRPHLLA